MKIAFVSAARSSHTVKWVNALARRGHTVRLYSLPDHKNTLGNLHPQVEVCYLEKGGFLGYFRNARQLARQMAVFQPDVVNSHYASGYGTLTRLAKVHPLVLSVWGSDVYDFPHKSPLHKKLVRDNLFGADAVASTSEVMARRVRQTFGYAKEIFITPFGVDCTLFSPVKEPVPCDTFRVGTVKALEEKYGMDILIRAFALLCEKLGDRPASLMIYGKGSQWELLESQIASLGLAGKVMLGGAVPNEEVPDKIRQMDAFCLPSVLDSESFGVSAVEAMACGVPVVASDVDGFTETVEDGVTGFLVPRRDPAAMASRLYALAGDPALCQKLGQAGRERALRLYDFEKNVDTMEQLYQKVIQK